jgi:hypothetical protein
MIDHLFRDLQVLQKADFLIGRIWLGVLVRRLGLSMLAALVAVFGLGMANVAGFYALQAPVGSVGAAAIVAIADLLIAAVILLVGSQIRPGPEMDLAFEVRKMAVDTLQADAREAKAAVDAVGQELRNARASVAAFVHNPLDTAAHKLLVPVALSVLKGLRSR